MRKEENPISIIWIILSFVFLVPFLGVLLLGFRFRHKKRELLKGGRTLFAVALTFLGMFFLFAFIDYTGPTDLLFSGYFFGIGSVIGLVFSLMLIKKGTLQEKYISAVEEHRLTELRSISAAMELPVETVIRDLQQMINDSIFPEAEIDAAMGIFTLRVYTPENQQVKTVKCQSCGATAVAVLGRGNVCQYCGAPVNY